MFSGSSLIRLVAVVAFHGHVKTKAKCQSKSLGLQVEKKSGEKCN